MPTIPSGSNPITSNLQVSSNAHYLVTPQGKPVFLLGDAGWLQVTMLREDGINTYFNDRAARGFNATLVEIIERGFSTNKPNNIDNVAPFTGANFTTPNEPYFQRADSVIEKALRLGIYCVVFPFYQGYSGSEDGWDTEIGAASNADMQSWGNWLGSRYKNHPNIIWAIGGDAHLNTPVDYRTKYDNFITGLQASGDTHLVTIHGNRPSLGSDYLNGRTWMTLNSSYSETVDLPTKALQGYAYSPAAPCLQIEAYYEATTATAQACRAQLYGSLFCGQTGHIYGHGILWYLGSDGNTWTNYLNSTGAQNMTIAAALIKRYPWYSLVPDSGHTTLTSGYGTLGNADYASCARTADGSRVFIYMPSNRSMVVDMTRLAGNAEAKWFDPTNGSYTTDAASPIANTGTHTFSRASTNSAGDADWILVLEG